jgi:ParB family chromosome partitioning protein
MPDNMAVVYRPIDDLTEYENNARSHDADQIQQIANSITEFGWTNPVLVDEDNGIIAGHGRISAAKILGISEIPTIQLTGLSDDQKRAYLLADNRLPLNASWDESLLRLELTELAAVNFDLNLLGFDPVELKWLTEGFEPGIQEDQGDLGEVSPPTFIVCPECGHEFAKDWVK